MPVRATMSVRSIVENPGKTPWWNQGRAGHIPLLSPPGSHGAEGPRLLNERNRELGAGQGCVKPVRKVKLGLGRERLFGTIDSE